MVRGPDPSYGGGPSQPLSYFTLGTANYDYNHYHIWQHMPNQNTISVDNVIMIANPIDVRGN